MNRREASRTIGLGILGAAVGGMPSNAATPGNAVRQAGAAVGASDRKKWSRQNFRGMESFIMPSFMPGLEDLDEEGIRNDVRHGIRQGFGALFSIPLGLRPAESRRLLEIMADEARGKIIVGGTSDVLTVDQSAAAFKHAESVGVSETLLGFDPRLQTEDEIYNKMKSMITSTNLGIVLYAAPNKAFRKFHPAGLPMNAINQLADLPNVIAVKLTQEINFVTAYQVAELVSDRVMVGAVNLEIVPLFANKYPVQWSGEWAVDAVQSPEKQYAVQFMDAVAKRRLGDAAKAYWAMQPALDAFFKLQGPVLIAGGHPWVHIKYYKWLTGGNGGILRDLKLPVDQLPILDAQARQTCKDAFQSVGINCVDLPDEAFVVGNAAYARGARMKDMASTPRYIA
jgi:4-hydroxy-tetrahydrodipicolinate synthase